MQTRVATGIRSPETSGIGTLSPTPTYSHDTVVGGVQLPLAHVSPRSCGLAVAVGWRSGLAQRGALTQLPADKQTGILHEVRNGIDAHVGSPAMEYTLAVSGLAR